MDYGMFTDAGNDAVDDIVRSARILNMSWPRVLRELSHLAEKPDFAEATDTVVRECVYDALRFADQDVPFYS